MAKISAQSYPRINDQDNPLIGCLDDTTLVDHLKKIPQDQMNLFIKNAIENAENKSGRGILNIPENADKKTIKAIYKKEGVELYKYFEKYPGDPAATAHQLFMRNYKEVGQEQFKLRSLQKERMNSGWRYQFLAFDCARASGRFNSVADIGMAEADFNAVINFKDKQSIPLSLYVSIKNRTNTMGGQDWPKAIQALEQISATDKNRRGPYLCVFGMAMDHSKKSRLIKSNSKTKLPYSVNTEIWYANYFWPFFSNYTYNEIMSLVLDVLLKTRRPELPLQIEIPEELIESFGQKCRSAELLDENGNFNNPHRLVEIFCKK